MHVLIYDPLFIGHHLNWVALLARGCEPYSDRITFATGSKTQSSPDFAHYFDPMPANFHVDETMPSLDWRGVAFEGCRIARRAWNGLSEAIRRHRPDHVYVPYADCITLAYLSRPGTLSLPVPPGQIDSVVLTGSFAYGANLSRRRAARARMQLIGLQKLPFGRVLWIDPVVYEWLGANCPKLAQRSVLAPDPVGPVATHEKCAARVALGLPTDGRLLACVGVLDDRKGIDEFIRSFVAAPLKATDRLLLAGRAKPEVIEALRAIDGRFDKTRIIQIDRMLTDAEVDLAISAADLVAAVHVFPEHIGSASIAIRAAAAARPVLASELGWPGYVTPKYVLGWIYPRDPSKRPGAIAESLDRAMQYVQSAAAKGFADFHCKDEFVRILTEPLRQKRSSRTLITA